MSKLNFKPGLWAFLLIFRLCIPVKAEHADHSSFQSNCELYEKGIKYLALSFLVTPYKNPSEEPSFFAD